MRAWLTSFIATGQAQRLVWLLMLAGLLVLGQYAYTEHDRRLAADALASPAVLPLIQQLTTERLTNGRQLDSLQMLLTQCQTRESTTITNYLIFQQHEQARIDSARRRGATLSRAQQQGKLAERYPAPRPR